MYLGGVVAHLFHSHFVFYCTNTSQLIYLFPDDQHLKFFHFCLFKKMLLPNMSSSGRVHSSAGRVCDGTIAKSEGSMHIPVIGIAKQFPKRLIFEPFSTTISIT